MARTGKNYRRLSLRLWLRCMLVMGKDPLWPIRFGAMTTELTIIGIILKNYLNPTEVLRWPTDWRCWHTSTWTTRGGLSHTVCTVLADLCGNYWWHRCGRSSSMTSTWRPRAASHTTLLADLLAESDGTDVDNNELPRLTTKMIIKAKTSQIL